MSHIKNQNIYHLVNETGKRTKCGLSNQYNDAVNVTRFNNLLKDKEMVKYCCKKCILK